MTGAKITVKCLLEAGVRDIFGYPGASLLSLMQAIGEEKKLNLYINAHEQFSAFAADGYARASGKVGVCIATSGPGATNLVTGIANAYMDSVPLVAVTGNVPLELLGTDAFQEVDIAGVTMPITKHNFIVKSVDSLASTLRAAFEIAQSGRKGPVLVDIPCNIFDETAKFPPVQNISRSSNNNPAIDFGPVSGLINSSLSPVICVGGGVIASGASDEVKELADKLCCPVVSTAMGIGAFDGTDPRCRGIVGMNTSGEADKILDGSDLLIAIGVRFSERMLCALRGRPGLKAVHIDIDPAEIDKNLSPFGALVGDAKEVLSQLNVHIDQRVSSAARCENVSEDPGIFGVLNEVFPDAIFTTEVGLHQTEACRKLKIKRPRGFITAGGLGAMGFGLPAAFGAAVANPGKKVINIAGDGSFGMNMPELATAVKYGVPLVQFVMNNRSLGMIEMLQKNRSENVKYCDLPQVDYKSLAKAFGAEYYSASDADSLRDSLIKAKKSGSVVLIENIMQELI